MTSVLAIKGPKDCFSAHATGVSPKRKQTAMVPIGMEVQRFGSATIADAGLASLGIRLEVIEKLLNHVSGSFAGVTGIYQRHTYMPEMRDALSKWEAHVASVITEREVSPARAA